MKILRKEGKGFKDYYDYLQQVYGQDELVVYDRRDAFPIDPTKRWGHFYNSRVEDWFCNEPICFDKQRVTIKRWKSKKLLGEKGDSKKSLEDIKEGRVLYFVLEVGYHHYYFEVERYIDDEDENKVCLNYGLVKKRDIDKGEKISQAPICLCPITYNKHWYDKGNGDFEVTEWDMRFKIDNPILALTYIPKFIDAHEIWNNLYEYISSLRDKEFTDTRTNDQHIESHGFDKRISFRHRK